MPLLIPLFTGVAGWLGGMWSSDGFSRLFWLAALIVGAFLAFKFWG